ncbi:GGDEF domain-containing protein [Paenibacillus sp. Z6-24]
MKFLELPHDDPEQLGKQSKWIRKFIHSYWLVVSVHTISQLVSFLFLYYPISRYEFYIDTLLIPIILMSGMILWTQWIHRQQPHLVFCAMSITSTFITWVIIYLHYDIRIIPALCLIPILSSVIFFRKRLLWFSSVLQMITFVTLYLSDAHFRDFLSSFDAVATPSFILAGTLIAHIILVSGRELMADLQTTMQAKQELIVRNAIMSKLSKTDGLTNLYNQISFRDYYDTAFKYADQGTSLHLALLDIDNFKQINDTYGHRVGDMVLGIVSQVIQQYVSSSDIAARYGGEEFALLILDKNFDEAYRLVENIRSHLSGLCWKELNNQAVTVSVGLHSCEPGLTKEQLFEQVDHYLYQAKRTGKNKTITARSIA